MVSMTDTTIFFIEEIEVLAHQSKYSPLQWVEINLKSKDYGKAKLALMGKENTGLFDLLKEAVDQVKCCDDCGSAPSRPLYNPDTLPSGADQVYVCPSCFSDDVMSWDDLPDG